MLLATTSASRKVHIRNGILANSRLSRVHEKQQSSILSHFSHIQDIDILAKKRYLVKPQ